jgi:hypothetical protein
MVVVDYTANAVRNYFTTLANALSIGTSTTVAITISSTTINNVAATVSRAAISYPDTKTFITEYLLSATDANGSILRRIAIKENTTTTQVITLSNIPDLEKNSLIEVSFEITAEVSNE